MRRVLRVLSFALLGTSAIGIAVYGATFADWARKPAGNHVVERVSFEEEQVSAIGSKANKQEVRAVTASNTADKVTESWPPTGAAQKEEVKPIAAPSMERWAPADAANKEEVKEIAASDVAVEEFVQPPVVKSVDEAKPISVLRAKKKATPKQKAAKRRNQDNVRISVPLILVPPQKVGKVEQSPGSVRGVSKEIKPVSEEARKIMQNFGPAKSGDHFRRK